MLYISLVPSIFLETYIMNVAYITSFLSHQDHWDLETTESPNKKIWKVANERYKSWRFVLHSTYKAYDSYDERMKHKPEDIDMYFGTKDFKVHPLL